MSDYEDLESEETEEPEAAPRDQKELDKELRKVRKENQTLRSRANELLKTHYGETIVERIPETVIDWDTRVALADQFKTLLAAQQAQTEETATQEEAPKEEPTPEEKQLAAVAKGPATGSPGTQRVSWEEYVKMRATPGQLEKALSMREAGLVDED